MYSFKGRVRYSETDCNRKMTFTAMLNYFQDCCTFQSEELGVGLDYLAGEQTAWLLVSWQVSVERCPVFGEQIRVCTWPYDFGGFYGYRNFVLEGADGEVLARANSVWVYVDITTGRPMRVTQTISEAYELEPRLEMNYGERKIATSGEYEEKESFPVHPSQIDTNLHVNNERYIEMAKDYLPKDFEIGEMQAEYRKSAVLGDTIYPMVQENGNIVTVMLSDEAKKPYAVVKFAQKGDTHD